MIISSLVKGLLVDITIKYTTSDDEVRAWAQFEINRYLPRLTIDEARCLKELIRIDYFNSVKG